MSAHKDDTPSGAQTPLKAASDTEVGVVGNISDVESCESSLPSSSCTKKKTMLT